MAQMRGCCNTHSNGSVPHEPNCPQINHEFCHSDGTYEHPAMTRNLREYYELMNKKRALGVALQGKTGAVRDAIQVELANINVKITESKRWRLENSGRYKPSAYFKYDEFDLANAEMEPLTLLRHCYRRLRTCVKRYEITDDDRAVMEAIEAFFKRRKLEID